MSRTAGRKLVSLRRVSQASFLALFFLACWKVSDIFIETDPNLMVFTALSGREFLHKLPAVLIFLVPTLVLGRFYCGWVCPMGTVIDGAGAAGVSLRADAVGASTLADAVRGRKNGLSDGANRRVRKPKLVLWALLLVLALAGFQYAWMLDPIVIAGRFVSLNLFPLVSRSVDWLFSLASGIPLVGGHFQDFYRGLGGGAEGLHTYGTLASWSMFALFVVVAGIAFWIPRLWCRSLCPLGAFYALVAGFAPMGRKADGCISCRICSAKCRMGAIRDDGEYEKGECILCMDCVYDCPANITSFKIARGKQGAVNKLQPISRKDFIFLPYPL